MSENLQNANTVEVAEVASGLPSEVATEEVNPYDISKFKDENGKLAGKFETADDLMKSYNEAQEYIQKINAERAREGNERAKSERIEKTTEQVKAVESTLLSEFSQGQASEESIAAAKEAGFSDERIELIKYKAKEATEVIVNHVGSMETYQDMINVLSTSLSVEEKTTFNEMIKTSAGSEIALLGLKAKYEALTNKTVETDRVRGSVSTSSTQGYRSQQEMLSDLKYIQTTGRNDKAAVAAYEAKKRATPDSIVFGR